MGFAGADTGFAMPRWRCGVLGLWATALRARADACFFPLLPLCFVLTAIVLLAALLLIFPLLFLAVRLRAFAVAFLPAFLDADLGGNFLPRRCCAARGPTFIRNNFSSW